MAQRKSAGPPGEPRRIAYLYLLPAFLVYAAFLLYPLVRSVQISLYDWNGNTLATWAGLDN
jgi:raffinose/stachyose/melibiose transport system permease protein